VFEPTDWLKLERNESLVVDDPSKDTEASTASVGGKPN